MSDDNTTDDQPDDEPEEDNSDRLEYDLSASRIKTHESCPRRYKLKYLDDREATKVPSGYGILGSLVHESIENTMIEHPNERDRSRLTSLFKQEFYNLERGYDMEHVDSKQRSDGIDCLEMAGKYISKQEFELRGIEVRCYYDVKNANLDSRMIGYMDVCTDNEIWDWKTGRIRDDTDRDELIQGSVYMAGYHEVYGELPEAIRFVYLKEGKVRSIDPTEENWMEMIRYAQKLMDSKESGEFPAKPEGGKCHFCAYEGWCEGSPVGAGQIRQAIENDPAMWEAF